MNKKQLIIVSLITLFITPIACAQTVYQKGGELCLDYKWKTYFVKQYELGDDDNNYYSLQCYGSMKSNEIPRGLMLIIDRKNMVMQEFTRDDVEYCPGFIRYDIDGDDYKDLILFWHTGTHSTFAEVWMNVKEKYVLVFEVFNSNNIFFTIRDGVPVIAWKRDMPYSDNNNFPDKDYIFLRWDGKTFSSNEKIRSLGEQMRLREERINKINN